MASDQSLDAAASTTHSFSHKEKNMSSPKTLAAGFVITVFSITLSGCAANAQLQLSEVDATCQQVRSDAEFLRQLAITEGNTTSYLSAAPPACKMAKTLSMDSAPRPHTSKSAV